MKGLIFVGKFKDLIGQRFGELEVLRRAEDSISPSGRHHTMWLCKCNCGNEKIIQGDNLTRGLTKSCGCLQRAAAAKANTTHGATDSRLYGVWCAMKRRCYNKSIPEYRLYGERGISICDEWKNDFRSFQKWAFENGYDESAPRGACTIDRIDTNGDYEPSNCRFVSQQEQMNNVRYNHHVTYKGETHTIAEWARMYDIPYARLAQRITRYGYDIDKALNKI